MDSRQRHSGMTNAKVLKNIEFYIKMDKMNSNSVIEKIEEFFAEAKSTGLPVDLAAVLARGFMPRASGDPKGRPLTVYKNGEIYRSVIAVTERILIEKALEHSAGNQLTAAKFLGINRNTLRSKIRKLNINQERFKA